MAVHITAKYRVKPAAVSKVKAAIDTFVAYVKANEPGTRLYAAWQDQRDPTQFLHLFIFADEAARAIHGQSAAVKAFQEVYRPELVGGEVVFTDFNLVASNQP